MASPLAVPVIIGLVVGIFLVVLFASIFNQPQNILSQFPPLSQPEPGRFRESAIKIALQNETLRQEFGGGEPVVTSYRDWVTYSYRDCPINWFAHIIFTDKSGAGKKVAVLVNMNSSKVVEIFADRDLLIAKTQGIEDARLFLNKYPRAKINVSPGLGYSEVVYEAT